MKATIKARYVNMTDAAIYTMTYALDHSLALVAETHMDREVLSVNLGDHGLTAPEGHVFVKDYSEHEGLVNALVEAGVAEKVRQVEFGPFDTTAWLMKISDNVTKGERG